MMSILLANLSLPDTYTPPVAPSFHFYELLWRLVMWTIFLMAMCLLMLLVSKARRRSRLATQTNSLRLQAVVPLSYRAKLYLVQVEEQTVAVASDAGGLRTLILLSPTFTDTLAHTTGDGPVTSGSLRGSADSEPIHSSAEVLSFQGASPANIPGAAENKAA
ncbi:MAG: hypothetical protein WHU94_00200 [Thermogemmata sp.]|jgi:flagellar biogenesis protein FliO